MLLSMTNDMKGECYKRLGSDCSQRKYLLTGIEDYHTSILGLVPDTNILHSRMSNSAGKDTYLPA